MDVPPTRATIRPSRKRWAMTDLRLRVYSPGPERPAIRYYRPRHRRPRRDTCLDADHGAIAGSRSLSRSEVEQPDDSLQLTGELLMARFARFYRLTRSRTPALGAGTEESCHCSHSNHFQISPSANFPSFERNLRRRPVFRIFQMSALARNREAKDPSLPTRWLEDVTRSRSHCSRSCTGIASN